MTLAISELSDLAYWAYDRFKFALKPEFKGAVSYGSVYGFCSEAGIEDKFLNTYGIAGDWEDPEDGSPINIDVGDFVHWLNRTF
jgi:hypothetical protein